jgi:hypothetical protein
MLVFFKVVSQKHLYSLGQGHGEEGQGFPSEIYSRRKTTTACQISGLFVYQSLLSFVEK